MLLGSFDFAFLSGFFPSSFLLFLDFDFFVFPDFSDPFSTASSFISASSGSPKYPGTIGNGLYSLSSSYFGLDGFAGFFKSSSSYS